MVIGHMGVAFGGRTLRKRISLWWFVVAAFAPDITRLAFQPFASGFTLNLLSHSVPAVALEGALVALVYWGRTGTAVDSWALALACFTHWPLDALTGCKATWPGGAVVGLALYQSPLLDLPLEAVVLLLGWSIFRQQAPERTVTSWRLPVALMVVQVMAVAGIDAKTGFFYAGGIAWRWDVRRSPVELHRMPPPPSRCPQPLTETASGALQP